MSDFAKLCLTLFAIVTVTVTVSVIAEQKQPIKPCPGEVVSMVIDKDGTVLCTYMMIPSGVVTKQKEMKK